MNTHRSTAILVGVFYIVGTVAGVLSMVFPFFTDLNAAVFIKMPTVTACT